MWEAWSAEQTKGQFAKFAAFWLYLLVCLVALVALDSWVGISGPGLTLAIFAVGGVVWYVFRPLFRRVSPSTNDQAKSD